MSQQLTLDLTLQQRELLLRGLRYVRSSRMMEFRDSAEITEAERTAELLVIRELMSLLDPKSKTPQAVPA